MRAHRSRAPVAVVAVAVVVMMAGCSPAEPDAPDGGGSGSPVGAPVLPDEATRALVEALPAAEGTGVSFERLADGLTPPTNAWFSGLVLAEQPQPVFPLPLSFALTESGVEFGVPTVTAQPRVIAAPHDPAMTLDLGSDSSVVTRYDEVSLTLEHTRGDEVLGQTTIARGSPVVGYTAVAEHEIAFGAAVERADDVGEGIHSLTVSAGTMLLVAPQGEVSADGRTLALPQGARADWVAVPRDASAPLSTFADLASAGLQGVTVEADVGVEATVTTLDYVTADDAETVLGRLPHQSEGGDACDLGEFATIYGPMQLCTGSQLQWSVPSVAPSGALDLEAAALSADERAELVDALEADVAASPDSPADTYFGGKALARLATLLQLARQLAEGDDETAERAGAIAAGLDERLRGELLTWAEPEGCDSRAERCFTYDDTVRGVVGLTPSFGSDEFNDHHFHYGNFLYASAVLAGAGGPGGAGDVDAELVEQLRPVIDLLAADLASSGGELFPVSRAFDPYSGHSWASGFAPFADGNNQESSSEAVSSANGLALWAQATGDEALAELAQWMLSSEAHSAQRYWLEPDLDAEPYAGFDRPIVGIVWDAKRDFGTWFSGEPAAALGIQLIPMHPVAGYVAGEGEHIRDAIDVVAPAGAQTAALFADYLLMYQALAGPEQAELALEAARALPVASIDDGNSRAYLLAFIMAQR